MLLDDAGELTGSEDVGEIAVQSRFLSPGYWGMPELTKARFLEGPQDSGERIYLTGDLGRMNRSGALVHLGRKDSSVKIRGFQVEVVEIEQVLLRHGGVRDAIVVFQEDPLGEARLLAYWVAQNIPEPTVSQLRSWLRNELPRHMIPQIFVKLDALPRTPAGKLDRRALPVPDKSRPTLDSVYVPPRNPVEATLASIWADVLEVEQVGVHDLFFDLGGHSLKAMQVISRVLAVFKVELPIMFLLNSPTIAEMADVVMTTNGRSIGQAELTRLLGELESMSEEEVRKASRE
jgi:non-ribosomal peptide synthetase component E (peptide arylation enzyme)